MNPTDVPDTRDHTIAWFRSAADVRAAESALERSGIESRYIDVARIPTAGHRREIDRRTWSSLGVRAAVGVVVGAALGALAGLLIGLLLGNEGTDLVGFALAGFFGGGPLGGIYMAGTRLPTEETTFDTFGGDQHQEEWIAISGPDDLQSEAARILQQQHPVRMDGLAA